MKDKIIEITDKLKLEEITTEEAQKQLVHLFGISKMLRRLNNHAKLNSYPSDSFKIKLKNFINNYC